MNFVDHRARPNPTTLDKVARRAVFDAAHETWARRHDEAARAYHAKLVEKPDDVEHAAACLHEHERAMWALQAERQRLIGQAGRQGTLLVDAEEGTDR